MENKADAKRQIVEWLRMVHAPGKTYKKKYVMETLQATEAPEYSRFEQAWRELVLLGVLVPSKDWTPRESKRVAFYWLKPDRLAQVEKLRLRRCVQVVEEGKEETAEDRVIKAAIAFVANEQNQMDYKALEGTISMDLPVEFCNLMEAVEVLKRGGE